MEIPTPPRAAATLAALARDRLTEASRTVAPWWNRHSRARLIRQMHARGLLADEHLMRTVAPRARSTDRPADVHDAPR
jgi:hypothetical protein